MKDVLVVKRVSYGKKDIPLQDREYVSKLSGAVGNRQDWLNFADENGYDGVDFIDLEVK